MKLVTMFLFASISMISAQLQAGAEHDHGAPTFQAPKGGVLKSTHNAHFELVKMADKVSLYAYDQAGKSLPTKNFKMKAELELPRKKASPIELVDLSSRWETVVKAEGAHRFTIKLNIDDGKEKDYVKFTVENK